MGPVHHDHALDVVPLQRFLRRPAHARCPARQVTDANPAPGAASREERYPGHVPSGRSAKRESRCSPQASGHENGAMIESEWRERSWRAIATVALLAHVLTPGSAAGAPHTEHFAAIEAATGARLNEFGDGGARRERRQRRVLEMVEAQLAREVLNLRGDTRIARRVDRWLTRRFAADIVFEPLLDDLADALRGETRLRHAAITAEVDARVAARPLTRGAPRARAHGHPACTLRRRYDTAARAHSPEPCAGPPAPRRQGTGCDRSADGRERTANTRCGDSPPRDHREQRGRVPRRSVLDAQRQRRRRSALPLDRPDVCRRGDTDAAGRDERRLGRRHDARRRPDRV